MSLLASTLILVAIILIVIIGWIAYFAYGVYKAHMGFQLHMGVNQWHSYEECLSFGSNKYATKMLLHLMVEDKEMDARLLDTQGNEIEGMNSETEDVVTKIYLYLDYYHLFEYRLIRRGGKRKKPRFRLRDVFGSLAPIPSAAPA